MISINSQSYPYLAVAQATGKDYDYLLSCYSLNEIYEIQKGFRFCKENSFIRPIINELAEGQAKDNVYARQIWNAAIEKAAQSVGLGMAEVELGELAAEIRKLKV